MNDQAGAPNADPERAFDGQYQLGSEIGAGARGVVYRGVDEKLDRAVAIKVWHARFDEGTPRREQYDTEARALTALEHPNIVAISDYGIAGQAPYLVMELLEGERLDERMRARMLTSTLIQSYMQSVLRALGYMHMRGIVHRNLKPANVYLQKGEAGETLKLLDLGLESLAANDNAGGGGSAVLLASAYDAPEREQGVEPDGRSDVYAAGVLMLHMLSGHEPARDVLRAAGQADAGALEWLAGLMPTAIAEVKAFIAKAIAYERSVRFGNADQMLRALLELPTPWLTGQEEEEPAPIPLVTSARPKSRPVHADIGSSETQAMPAADSGSEPETEAPSVDDEAEVVLKPFGLIARLRARKKLFLIAGGVVALGAAAVALASFLNARAATEKAAEQAPQKPTAKPEANAIAAQAAAALEHPYPVEEVEEIEEGDEAVVKGAAGASAPVAAAKGVAQGSEQAHPELLPKAPDVLRARDAAPGGASAKGMPEPNVQRASKADERTPVEPAREPSAAQHEQASQPSTLHGDTSAAAHEQTAQPTAAAAAPAAPKAAPGELAPQPVAAAAPAAPKAAPGELAPQPAAAAVPNAAPREPALQPTAAAPEGKPPGEAALAPSSAGNAKVDEPSQPSTADEPKPEPTHAPPPKKPRTPQELGSERHIQPDQREIRQLLALALKSSPRVAAADPWNIGEGAVPQSLQALRDAIAHGERGTPTNIKALRRFNAANPDDVFGHLLLAGFYANRGYSLDALDQYDLAYRIDSSSRGAPEMLKHALSMVAQGIAQAEAERFIEHVYGREAQASITAELRAKDTSAAAAARLRQLQARLAGKRR